MQEELEKLISEDRPLFWKHALTLLIDDSNLSEGKINELVQICKYEQGLIDEDEFEIDVQTCDIADLIQLVRDDKQVVLDQITEANNVNALSPDQKLKFRNNSLTVIYGDNGSGKSGYGRILRQVCRFRGEKEEIIPNIFKDGNSKEPTAKISYSINGVSKTYNWIFSETNNRDLKHISVFDRDSAVKYIEEKNEVAYRPRLLSILDDFASTLDRVSHKLKEEINSIELESFEEDFQNNKSAIGRFIYELSSSSEKDKLDKLAKFGEEDQERLDQLINEISTIKSGNPQKKIRELKAKIKRFKKLKRKIICYKKGLNKSRLKEVKKLTRKYNTAKKAAELATKDKFKNEPLEGVGSDVWIELWESAKSYSETFAYPDMGFPKVDEGSRCVLCQQKLNEEGKERLKGFKKFVKDNTSKKAKNWKKKLEKKKKDIFSISFELQEIEDLFEELNVADREELSSSLKDIFKNTKKRETEIISSIDSNNWRVITALDSFPLLEFNNYLSELEAEKNKYLDNKEPDKLENLEEEKDKLQEKKKLSEKKESIKEQIGKLTHIEKLKECKKQTLTTIVTRVSNKLTEMLVTETLSDSFEKELRNIGFKYFDIRLEKAPGSKGVTYHRLVIDGREEIDIGNILSEGEYRCISLTHFLSELNLGNSKSGIVFDDPVSSLDHKWSSRIANRLVKETVNRQVIVFTHDITFLMRLEEFATEKDVDINVYSLDRKRKETGIVNSSPPWHAQSVKRRIGSLKQHHQQISSLELNGTEEEYNKEVGILYGNLRETWEKLVEKLLLNSVVLRFGRDVQTKRVKRIVDISENDYKKIKKAMAKCSKYLVGHDESPKLNEPMPTPDEILDDISEIDEYRKELQGDRKRHSR